MNHLAELKQHDAGYHYAVCSCGWDKAGNYQAVRDAFTEHIEAHTPQWRDRPSGPGWWVCRMPSPGYPDRRYTVALRLSQQDLDNGQPHSSYRVYGPIPDDPEETP